MKKAFLQVVNISLNGTPTKLIPELSGRMLAQPQSDPPARYAYLNPILDQFIPENAHKHEEITYLQQRAEEVIGAKSFARQ